MSYPVCPGSHEQRLKFTKCTDNGQGSKQYAKDTKHISVDEWDFIRSFGGEMFKNYLLTKHLKKVTACTSKLFQWLHPRNIDEAAEEVKQTSKKVVQKTAGKKIAAGKSSLGKQTSNKLMSGKSAVGKQTSAWSTTAKPNTVRAAAAAKSTSASKSMPTRTSPQLTSIRSTTSIPFIQKFDFLDKFDFLPNADLFGAADVRAQSREYENTGASSWFKGGGGELLFPTVTAQSPTFIGREETDGAYRESNSGVGREFTGHTDWLEQELRHKFGRGSATAEFDFEARPAAAFGRKIYESFEPSRTFGSGEDDFRLKTFPENELRRLFGPDNRPVAYDALDYFAGHDAGFRFPEDFTHMDYFAQGEIGGHQSPTRLAAERVMKAAEIFGSGGYTHEPIYAMRTGVPNQISLGPKKQAVEGVLKGVEIFGSTGYTNEPIYAVRTGMLKQTRLGSTTQAAKGVMQGGEISGNAGYTREPIYTMRTREPNQISFEPRKHTAEGVMKRGETLGGAGRTREPIYAMRTAVLKQTRFGPTTQASEGVMQGGETLGGAGHTREPIYAMRTGVPKQSSLGTTRHSAEGVMKGETFGGAGYPNEHIYTMRTGMLKQRPATESAARKLDCAPGEAGCVAGAQYLDALPQSKRGDSTIARGNTEVINYLQHSRLPRQGKHIGTALAPALNEAPKLMDSSQLSGLRFGPRETVASKFLEYAREGHQGTNFGPRRMEASRFFAATNASQQKHILHSPFGPGQLAISKYFTQTGMPRTRHLLQSEVAPRTPVTADPRTRNLEALKHLTQTVRFHDDTLDSDAHGTGNIGAIKSLIQAGALQMRGTIAPFALNSRNIAEFKTLVKTGDPRLGNYFRAALGPRNVAALKFLVQTGQLRQGNIVGVDGGSKSAFSRRFDGPGREVCTDAARSSEEADLECATDAERVKPLVPQAGAKETEAHKNSQRTIAPTRAPKGVDYGGDGDYTRTRHRRTSPGRVPLTYTKFPAYAGIQPPELPRHTRMLAQQQLAGPTDHVRATTYARSTRAPYLGTVPNYRYREASPQLRRTVSPHHATVFDRGFDAGQPRRVRQETGSPQRGPFTYARFPAYVGQQHKELHQPSTGGPHVGVQSKVPRGYENIRIPRFTRYQHRISPPSEDAKPRKTFRDLTPTGTGREVPPSMYTRKYPYLQYIRDTDYGGHRTTRAYRFVQSPFKATKFARYVGRDVVPNNIPSKTSPQVTESHGTSPYGATSYGTGLYGIAPHSTGPYGIAPHSTGSYGAAPHSAGPYGTAPYDTGPHGGVPYTIGPYGTAPYGTGPNGGGPYTTGPYGGGTYTTGPYGTAPYGTGPHGTAPYDTDPYDVGLGSKYRRKTRVQHSKHVIPPAIERNYIADEGYTGHKYEPIVNYLGSMNYGVDNLYQHERALLEMEKQREREKERLASFVESLNLFYNIINKPELEAELSSDEDEFSLNYGYEPNERSEAAQKKLTLLEIVELLRSGNKTRFHPVVYHEPFSKNKPWTWMQNFPTKIPAEYLRHLSVDTLTALKAWQRQQTLMVERANGKGKDGKKKKSK